MRLFVWLFFFCSIADLGFADDDSPRKAPRQFELTYAADIQDVPVGSTLKVWFPVATSNELQSVDIIESTATGKLSFAKDRDHGNKIGYFETVTNNDQNSFELRYRVKRKEAFPGSLKTELSSAEKKLYLSANKLVPTDGRPAKLIENLKPESSPLTVGRQLYDVVEAYMQYDKSKPGYGNGDVLWACNSKTGNCTDFHSLFISLARNRNIPARFEIGFPIPTGKKQGKLGGYHCWAWFHTAEHGWVGVDISEADKHPEMKEYYFGRLTPDRVAFSTGRDIKLVPESNIESLNYFVFPHVEVDGKVWPQAKIKMRVDFLDF